VAGVNPTKLHVSIASGTITAKIDFNKKDFDDERDLPG
jgi:hypothetical protein